MALDLHLSRVHRGVAAMRQDCNYQFGYNKIPGKKGNKKKTRPDLQRESISTVLCFFSTLIEMYIEIALILIHGQNFGFRSGGNITWWGVWGPPIFEVILNISCN